MNYIYIITDGLNYKIGYSKNPKFRLNQLQTGNNNQLSILYTESFNNPQIHLIEKLIHRSVCSYCKHKRGEWFNVSNIQSVINDIQIIKMHYDEIDDLKSHLAYFKKSIF